MTRNNGPDRNDIEGPEDGGISSAEWHRLLTTPGASICDLLEQGGELQVGMRVVKKGMHDWFTVAWAGGYRDFTVVAYDGNGYSHHIVDMHSGDWYLIPDGRFVYRVLYGDGPDQPLRVTDGWFPDLDNFHAAHKRYRFEKLLGYTAKREYQQPHKAESRNES